MVVCPGVHNRLWLLRGVPVSNCAECSEHYSCSDNTCFHSMEQVRNNRGKWVSKVLKCPKFQEKAASKFSDKWARERGYI